MTTVSKPNKNPASAEVMAQKKMRAFRRGAGAPPEMFAVVGVGRFMIFGFI